MRIVSQFYSNKKSHISEKHQSLLYRSLITILLSLPAFVSVNSASAQSFLPSNPSNAFINSFGKESVRSLSDLTRIAYHGQNNVFLAFDSVRFMAFEQCSEQSQSAEQNQFCLSMHGTGFLWDGDSNKSESNSFKNGHSLHGTIGAGYHFAPGWLAGASVTFGSGEHGLRYNGKNEIDTWGISSFIRYAPSREGLQFLGAFNFNQDDYDLKRIMKVRSDYYHFKGSADGTSMGLLGRIGWGFAINDKLTLTPYAELIWTRVKRDAYNDNYMGYSGFSIGSQTYNETDMYLGLNARYSVNQDIELFGSAAWGHQLSNSINTVQGTVSGYTLEGVDYKIKSDWAEVTAGINYNISKNVRASSMISATFGRTDRPDYAVRLGLSYTF